MRDIGKKIFPELKDVEIRIIPKLDQCWGLYWTAECSAFDGCVGGGETPMEALKEFQENVSVYLTYQRSEEQ